MTVLKHFLVIFQIDETTSRRIPMNTRPLQQAHSPTSTAASWRRRHCDCNDGLDWFLETFSKEAVSLLINNCRTMPHVRQPCYRSLNSRRKRRPVPTSFSAGQSLFRNNCRMFVNHQRTLSAVMRNNVTAHLERKQNDFPISSIGGFPAIYHESGFFRKKRR